jgi:hypothetical protein
MSTMQERVQQDDPGTRRLKITRASAGSFGKKADEAEVRRVSAEEEQDMILSGLDQIVAGAGSTGFGDFVKKAVDGSSSQVHGYVDDQGMPHSAPEQGFTGFAGFQRRVEAGDGREDHNYTEDKKVSQPTKGFGAGEGIDTRMQEDRKNMLDDSGMMSTSQLLQKIEELIPKEEKFRIPPEPKDLPPEQHNKAPKQKTASLPLDRYGQPLSIGDTVELEESGQRGVIDEMDMDDPRSTLVSVNFEGIGTEWESASNLTKIGSVRTADDSTPDGTQWQSEVVDETKLRSRDLPDIPEELPEKYVPEKGDGSHPLPNESFEDWGTPPTPGRSQNYPEDPAKLTNIMGSLTRIRLTDGRVIVGRIVSENAMKLQMVGRMAGDRSDSSFDLWKRDIVGPREAVRMERRSREIRNLDAAYDLYDRTREAKDPKKEYPVEKVIETPPDGVDRAMNKATNARPQLGARPMKKDAKRPYVSEVPDSLVSLTERPEVTNIPKYNVIHDDQIILNGVTFAEANDYVFNNSQNPTNWWNEGWQIEELGGGTVVPPDRQSSIRNADAGVDRYSLQELEAMPTIMEGQFDDLKVEETHSFEDGDSKVRVWLSRMTKEDGMPYDNQVTVEMYGPPEYKRITVDQYEPEGSSTKTGGRRMAEGMDLDTMSAIQDDIFDMLDRHPEWQRGEKKDFMLSILHDNNPDIAPSDLKEILDEAMEGYMPEVGVSAMQKRAFGDDPEEIKDLYDRLKDAGCELDSHESDLYVKKTPEAVSIINQFQQEKNNYWNLSAFTGNDGEQWLEVPFGYSPWWDAKAGSEEGYMPEVGVSAMQKKGKVHRLPSGRWMDTNGNSYDTYEEAVGQESANVGGAPNLEETHEPEEGSGVRRLPSGRYMDINGNSYDTYEEAEQANKANYASRRKVGKLTGFTTRLALRFIKVAEVDTDLVTQWLSNDHGLHDMLMGVAEDARARGQKHNGIVDSVAGEAEAWFQMEAAKVTAEYMKYIIDDCLDHIDWKAVADDFLASADFFTAVGSRRRADWTDQSKGDHKCHLCGDLASERNSDGLWTCGNCFATKGEKREHASRRTAGGPGAVCSVCGVPETLTGILDNEGVCQKCRSEEETGSREAADKEKKISPKTGPESNVATVDRMNDETFYGDDKALHDQLDKHEKRASVLKREALVKLKMADNYEKAKNFKMAKEMDMQGTALYNEWKQVVATIGGMKKRMAEEQKIVESARPAKLFFQNQETPDKNNPFA